MILNIIIIISIILLILADILALRGYIYYLSANVIPSPFKIKIARILFIGHFIICPLMFILVVINNKL